MNKKKKKKNRLKKSVYRCVKISRDTMFDYLFEKLTEQQEDLMDVKAKKTSQAFLIDPESGDMIFCVYRDEDENGDEVHFPRRVDADGKRLIKAMPYTTEDLLKGIKGDEIYCDYTEEQLLTLQRTGGIRVRKSE